MTSFALLRIHKDIDASRLADPAQAVDELVTPHRWMIGHARLIHKDSAPVATEPCVCFHTAGDFQPNGFRAPPSSSGQGHRPFKAEITGSNPVGGTIFSNRCD